MEDARPTDQSATLWIVAEAAILCALGLLAIFWLIPSETISGGGVGLDPGTLPTACVAAAVALIALDAAVRLAGRSSPPGVPLPAGPTVRIIAVCVIAGALLPFTSPALLTLLVLPPLMLLLGERSLLRIAATSLLTAAVIALALFWRG
jgi:hypothetical protein